MINVVFIHDGHHKGWRYKMGEKVLLPDDLGQLAIDEGMAVWVDKQSWVDKKRRQNALDRNAYKSEKRSLT